MSATVFFFVFMFWLLQLVSVLSGEASTRDAIKYGAALTFAFLIGVGSQHI